MKRILAVIVALIMVSALAACGSSGGNKPAGNETTGGAEIQTTAAGGDQQETAGGETEAGDETEIETAGEAETEPEADVDGELILDAEGVKVYSQGISEDDFWGAVVNLTLINNAGKTLTFQPRKTSVNGIMVDPSMSETLEDGETVETTLEFLDDFDTLGIETVAEVEFALHIYDEDWKVLVDSEQIVVRNPDAGSYTQLFDDRGEVAYDEDGIKIVVQGLEDSFFGPQVLVYIENDSKQDISVSALEATVDGVEMDPTMYQDVLVGKVAIGKVSFNDLDADTIEELEISFHIEVMDDFEDIADTDPITVTF